MQAPINQPIINVSITPTPASHSGTFICIMDETSNLCNKLLKNSTVPSYPVVGITNIQPMYRQVPVMPTAKPKFFHANCAVHDRLFWWIGNCLASDYGLHVALASLNGRQTL
jgi:hypothetical protein